MRASPPAPFSLEAAVRFGSHPDDPQLLYAYLSLCDEIGAWQVYLRAHRIMLAIIVDPKVPRHWRWLCLDHAYRPLSGLYRLARSEEERETLRQCNHELSLSSHLGLAADPAHSRNQP
ncbi:MAG: hypothetical protein AAF184_06475 [Pseudomonadota bacterium]